MKDLIQTESLAKTYRSGPLAVEALKELSIQVEKGEFIAVTGSSGSGKSTLLNLLGGLDSPSSGMIRVDGRDLHTFNRRDMALYRRHVAGMVFQSFNLIPERNAAENVELPLIFCELPRVQRMKRVAELLERVGLSERSSHKPSELSGGEQQRVAIARALANQPRLLLADEPTGNLDSVNAREILCLLSGLNREMGLTVVLVTHEIDLAREFASRVLCLHDGRLAAGGEAA